MSTNYIAENDAANELACTVMQRVGATSRNEVWCPREQSFMTPCVARDGALALADDGVCVACGIVPSAELARVFPPGEGDR
jgi:hypothetical protein